MNLSDIIKDRPGDGMSTASIIESENNENSNELMQQLTQYYDGKNRSDNDDNPHQMIMIIDDDENDIFANLQKMTNDQGGA